MDHVYEYFEQKRSRFKRVSCGLASDAHLDELFSSAPDGQSGYIFGWVPLDDDAFIAITERVALIEGRPHRERYAYFLIVDGAEVRGYERDPTHQPAEHRHNESHDPEPWDAVNFMDAAEDFWDILTQERKRQELDIADG